MNRLNSYSKKEIGIAGEKVACKFLNLRNYKILNKNWSCRAGEIDIIAIKENKLSIIEVKTRKEGAFGDFSPFSAVDYKKQNKIQRLGDIYLEFNKRKLKKYKIKYVQFDIIGVFYRKDINKKLLFRVQHMKEAFDGYYSPY